MWTRPEITYRLVSRASREFTLNESSESVIVRRIVSIPARRKWEIHFGRKRGLFSSPRRARRNEIPRAMAIGGSQESFRLCTEENVEPNDPDCRTTFDGVSGVVCSPERY